MYDSNRMRALRTSLPDILSVSNKESSERLQRAGQEVCKALANWITTGFGTGANHWQALMQTSLPQERINTNALPCEPFIRHGNDSKNKDSCRFLSTSSDSVHYPERLERVATKYRPKLFNGLEACFPENLTDDLKSSYLDLMKWRGHLEGSDGQPFGVETLFATSIEILERHFINQNQQEERNWRERQSWPSANATPPEARIHCSERALDVLTDVTNHLIHNNLPKDTTDYLAPVISANLSANRALREYARLDAIGQVAKEMVVPFLRKLNEIGMSEIPKRFIEHPPLDTMSEDACIRGVLEKWFGRGGKAIEEQTYFNRPLNEDDIGIVLRWSQIVRENYIARRAAGWEPGDVQAQCGLPPHRFMFALTVVASFYGKTRAPKEIPGEGNEGKGSADYAIFPPRGTLDPVPKTHAWMVLTQAYGLILFGNYDWNLLPEGVSAYADATSHQRQCIERLIVHAVKGRTAPQLLALHTGLLNSVAEI